MSTTSPLTDKQITFFKTHGYVILKNLFHEASLEQSREQLWRKLGSSLETPETWPRDRDGLADVTYDPPESNYGAHPALAAIMKQLGGDDFMLGDGVPIIRWPEPDGPWAMPQTGHINAYGGRWIPFMYGATAYLYDVEPKGGDQINIGKSTNCPILA